MRICYFGNFDPDYARNNILMRGLSQNGVEVALCNTGKKGIKGIWDLFKKYKRIGSHDLVVVGYSDSRLMVPLVKILSTKKIIWDAFYSLYDSWVFDRKLVSPKSLKAKYYWVMDWLSMRLADIVLFDTNQHIEYAKSEFGVEGEKLRRIWVGAQDNIFFPIVRVNAENFKVLFFGSFIPLQGIKYILRAAKLIEDEDIRFFIIGGGQEKDRMLDLARGLSFKKLNFIDYLKPDLLKLKISEADVCLGIFGDTPKAKRVIPNKVYISVAMRKPVITADTPAIRELFTEDDLMLVPAADPESLAAAILKLKEDKSLREKISNNGYNKFVKNATPKILGGELKKIINSFEKV